LGDTSVYVSMETNGRSTAVQRDLCKLIIINGIMKYKWHTVIYVDGSRRLRLALVIHWPQIVMQPQRGCVGPTGHVPIPVLLTASIFYEFSPSKRIFKNSLLLQDRELPLLGTFASKTPIGYRYSSKRIKWILVTMNMGGDGPSMVNISPQPQQGRRTRNLILQSTSQSLSPCITETSSVYLRPRC
jgi:hypothetical protein